MGFFGGKEEKKLDKELENAHKHVEIILCDTRAALEKEIAKRIESGRIIKKLDYEMNASSFASKRDDSKDGNYYSVLILYDTWAEKAKTDKERGIGLGR